MLLRILGAAVYAEHHPLPRWAMAVVMLGPAVALTLAFGVLLTVPALGAVAVWAAGLNLSGAVVDFAMAAWLWHLPRGSWVEDLRDGVRVLRSGESTVPARPRALLSPFIARSTRSPAGSGVGYNRPVPTNHVCPNSKSSTSARPVGQ